MTEQDFNLWIYLTYQPDRRHYGGWEFIWKEPPLKVTSAQSELKRLNKLMIQKYPFLLPRNRWTDEVPVDYDYSYNEWEAIELGWQLTFGYKFLNELKDQLVKENRLDSFRIVQIKEKFGELHFYCNACTQEVNDIIKKYCAESYKHCLNCGRPTKYQTHGWINFICEECAKKLDLKDYSPIEGETNE